MLKDKKSGNIISSNAPSIMAPSTDIVVPQAEIPDVQATNGVMAVLNAMITILKSVKWEYGVPNSPNIFRTVQIDDGQYERIISPSGNMEETLGFPAAFIHFINWHYLVQQGRIDEGRSELRIRFILNRLNPHVRGKDMDVYYVAERIHETIQENIQNYECLQERCQLLYVDPMESFDNSLQPCWMTYEVWFKKTNVWIERNKIYKKFVFPPYTNHSDQEPGSVTPGHTDATHPEKYDDWSGYKGVND